MCFVHSWFITVIHFTLPSQLRSRLFVNGVEYVNTLCDFMKNSFTVFSLYSATFYVPLKLVPTFSCVVRGCFGVIQYVHWKLMQFPSAVRIFTESVYSYLLFLCPCSVGRPTPLGEGPSQSIFHSSLLYLLPFPFIPLI